MKLKVYLKENKITMSSLGVKLGVKRQTISSQIRYWENGGEPSLKSIKLWAAALEISNEEFINLLSK